MKSAANAQANAYRIGVDVGGTFTDLILLDPAGGLAVRKVLSTPPDFSEGILGALDALLADLGLAARDISAVAHGTTVATNALLTHTGARTALITTEGFRDVLEFGRLRTPQLYDIAWERSPPLVPRQHRLEVMERMLASGEALTSLNPASVAKAARVLRDENIESVAVCLLNSYRNSEHEEEISAILAREAPNVFVSLSSAVLPEIREFERTSTTVVNAYIRPVVQRYLTKLVAGLGQRGIVCPLLVMQSNGGVVSSAAASTRPIHIIESGPAAGVVGALTISRRIGLDDVICFDMGGTTAKACAIEGGRLSYARECEVGGHLNSGHRLLGGGGYLVRSPILDIAEVGAGGGSIARVAEGLLKVGPQSASAVPGPACYGRGGTAPTVTDANVVLGYLNPDTFAGGSIPIDAEAARRAIHDHLAVPLGIDVTEAAFGVHRIANATMIRAVRAISVEHGRDPRKFALFAFGGGGPVHGAHLAQALEMSRMIVPPVPGLFSSLGLLCSPQEHHYARTFWRHFTGLDTADVARVLRELAEEAFDELAQEGFPRDRVVIEASADIRYLGQNSELSIPIAIDALDRLDLTALRESFEAEHEIQYGYRSAGEAVQFTSLRIVSRAAAGGEPRWNDKIWSGAAARGAGASRAIYFGPTAGWAETPLIARHDLGEGMRAGPLAIEEYDSTTIVPPDAKAGRDDKGNIVVELAQP